MPGHLLFSSLLFSILLCSTFLFSIFRSSLRYPVYSLRLLALLLKSYVVWLLYSCLDRYSTRLSFLLCPRVRYFTLSLLCSTPPCSLLRYRPCPYSYSYLLFWSLLISSDLFCALLFPALLFSALLCSGLLCSSLRVLHPTLPCSAVLYSALLLPHSLLYFPLPFCFPAALRSFLYSSLLYAFLVSGIHLFSILLFPECVAKGSRFTLGVWGRQPSAVGNRPQPTAPVRNDCAMAVPLGSVPEAVTVGGPKRCVTSCHERGTS